MSSDPNERRPGEGNGSEGDTGGEPAAGGGARSGRDTENGERTIRRRDLLNALTATGVASTAGCSMLGGTGGTPAGRGASPTGDGAEGAASSETPSSYDCRPDALPPAELAFLGDFRYEGPISAEVGDSLTVPPVAVSVDSVDRAVFVGLRLKLLDGDGNVLSRREDYHRVKGDVDEPNYVPREPIELAVPYRDEDGEPRTELIREGATLVVECPMCRERTVRSKPQKPVFFQGTFRDIADTAEVSLAEIPVGSGVPSTSQRITTSWGVVWVAGAESSDRVVIHENGTALEELTFDEIEGLTRLGDAGYAFVGWNREDPVVVQEFGPGEGNMNRNSWDAGDPEGLSAAGTEPVWVEHSPSDAAYLFERDRDDWALVQAGSPVQWDWYDGDHGPDTEKGVTLQTVGDRDADWTLNGQPFYRKTVREVTDTGEGETELREEFLGFGEQEWLLQRRETSRNASGERVGVDASWGDLVPSTIERPDPEDRPFDKAIDTAMNLVEGHPAGTDSVALQYYFKEEDASVLVSPTGWESRLASLETTVPVESGIAFVTESLGSQYLHWSDWRSEQANRITLYSDSASLGKPVWDRVRDGVSGEERTLMYGKTSLTMGRSGNTLPYFPSLGGGDIAYVEEVTVGGKSFERICTTVAGSSCSPLYGSIDAMVDTPDGLAYLGREYDAGERLTHYDRRTPFVRGISLAIDGRERVDFRFRDAPEAYDPGGAAQVPARVAGADGLRTGWRNGRVAYWEHEPDRGYRFHLTGPDEDRQTALYETVHETFDEPGFVGALVERATDSGTGTFLVGDFTERQPETDPDPPDDLVTEKQKHAIATELAMSAYDARLAQLKTKRDVLASIQRKIRQLPPMQTQKGAALVELPSQKGVEQCVRDISKRKTAAVTLLPLLADLADLILTVFDVIAFAVEAAEAAGRLALMEGLERSLREAGEETAAKTMRRAIQEESAAAIRRLKLEAVTTVGVEVLEELTEYTLPEPNATKGVAAYWTTAASDLAPAEQRRVIAANLETAAFRRSKPSFEWERKRILELKDTFQKYDESETSSGRNAAIIRMIRIYEKIEKKKTEVEGRIADVRSKRDEFRRKLERTAPGN